MINDNKLSDCDACGRRLAVCAERCPHCGSTKPHRRLMWNGVFGTILFFIALCGIIFLAKIIGANLIFLLIILGIIGVAIKALLY